MVIIKDILQSEKTWDKEHKRIMNIISDGIQDKNIFETKIKFKFYESSKEEIEMFITDYLTNIIVWLPYAGNIDKVKPRLNVDDIFICDNINCDQITNYINHNLSTRFHNMKLDIKNINIKLASLIEGLVSIGEDFDKMMGLTLNVYNLIQLAKKNKRFRELINLKIPEHLQPNEIEEFIRINGDELIEILKTEDNCFKPLLNAGDGVRKDQLLQMIMNHGTVPDLEGNTHVVPINTNQLQEGLNSPAHYLLDAEGGRKAAIMNKLMTGRSGYFTRKVSLLCSNLTLNPNPKYDCKTKNYIKYKIYNEDYLKRISGRYIKLNEKSKISTIVDYDKDKDLIGKTVYMRSPIKCASKHGVCRKCYGTMYDVIGSHRHAGFIAAVMLTATLIQRILSAKHLLKTFSKKIELSPEFDKYFILDGDVIKLDSVSLDSKIDKYYLVLPSEIEDDNDYAEFEDDVYEYTKYIQGFKIAKYKKSEGYEFICSITEKDSMSMYLTEYMVSLMSEKKYKHDDRTYIPLSAIDEDESLFIFKILNNELNKPLEKISKLLDTNEISKNYTSVDEVLDTLIHHVIKSKISLTSIHLEMIVKGLIRDKEDILKIPDFTKEVTSDDYQMISIRRALLFHPSIIVSLAYERLSQQFKNPLTFYKNSPSLYDPLFMIRPQSLCKNKGERK